MAQRTFDIDSLAKRYGLTAQAVRKYIREKEALINKDGVHVKKVGKSWIVDEVAVKIIDGLRNVSTSVVENAAEADRVTELLEENSSLKSQLLVKMDELAQAHKALSETHKLLADSRIKAIEAKGSADKYEAERDSLKLSMEELKKSNDLITKMSQKTLDENKELEAEVSELRDTVCRYAADMKAIDDKYNEAVARSAEEKQAYETEAAERLKQLHEAEQANVELMAELEKYRNAGHEKQRRPHYRPGWGRKSSRYLRN